MRALLITPVLPAATGNGLSMRAGLWLEALASRFETDVAVAALFAPHASAQAFTAALADSTTMLSGTLAQTPGLPRPVPTLDEPSTTTLSELFRAADVVVVFRLYLAGLADPARQLGVPVVLDLDDLDWVREQRLGDHAEADAYRAYADAILGIAAVATTAAIADTDAGPAIHASPTWMHVPNGVPAPSAGSEHDGVSDVDLLFVATLGYAPNIEGATWLAREVMPLLPGVTAAIVGAAPTPEVIDLSSDRITVAADVPNVTPWYRRARVCVVPIHSGSGTRTKIPEAWAHRRPVVTTTLGAEGIDVAGAAIVGDDAKSFAAACARLLADADLARTLVDAGFERYRRAHQQVHALKRAAQAIDTALIAAGRTPAPRRVHA